MTIPDTRHHDPMDVSLHRSEPASDAFLAVLADLADAIDADWRGATIGIDPEHVHDLRVALRRTRSVIGQAKGVLPDSTRTRFRSDFSWLAAATGPTRDLDVIAFGWSDFVSGLRPQRRAAATHVLAHIERRRDAARAEMVATLESARAAEVLSAWRQALAEVPSTQPAHADRPIGRHVAKRFEQAHAQVLRAGRGIDGESGAEALHDLRKDAKKLRYLVECFGSLMPRKARSAYLSQLKGLQDNLGEHQDARVHLDLLDDIATELAGESAPPDALVALGQLIERLERIGEQTRTEFGERFEVFDSKRTEGLVDAISRSLRRH
ncbi:MAG: hypothetical protein JWN39_1029 [Ilumatobacteraceae bacterium]|nr:hypothetical protein [Ilumatobacteraceae bacterium]